MMRITSIKYSRDALPQDVRSPQFAGRELLSGSEFWQNHHPIFSFDHVRRAPCHFRIGQSRIARVVPVRHQLLIVAVLLVVATHRPVLTLPNSSVVVLPLLATIAVRSGLENEKEFMGTYATCGPVSSPEKNRSPTASSKVSRGTSGTP